MTTKEFIQYVSQRPEMIEKMSTCRNSADAYAIAQEAGLTDDMATFEKVMLATKAEAEKITDSDLENITAAGAVTVSLTVSVIAPAAAVSAGLV